MILVHPADAVVAVGVATAPSIREGSSTSHLRMLPGSKGAFLGLLRWNSYGTERAQPVAKVQTARRPPTAWCSDKPLPAATTGCRLDRMVRRGSTVRVRQRASLFSLLSPDCRCRNGGHLCRSASTERSQVPGRGVTRRPDRRLSRWSRWITKPRATRRTATATNTARLAAGLAAILNSPLTQHNARNVWRKARSEADLLLL